MAETDTENEQVNDPPKTAPRSDAPDPRALTKLGEFSENTLLDARTLADALDVSCRTVRRWVATFQLPPGIKLGRSKVWAVKNVLAYLDERAENAALKEAQFREKVKHLL